MQINLKKLPNIYKYTLQRTPLKRWGSCEEVADLILFLLSNNSLYINGNNIFIDGGWNRNENIMRIIAKSKKFFISNNCRIKYFETFT